MSLKNRRFFSSVFLALILGPVACVNDAHAGHSVGGKGNSGAEQQVQANLIYNATHAAPQDQTPPPAPPPPPPSSPGSNG